MPPAFCHSENVRLLNDVIPTFPRSLPLFLFFSLSFILRHCSFDIPLGIYSIVIAPSLVTKDGVWMELPAKEPVNAEAGAVTATTASTVIATDLILVVCVVERWCIMSF